MSSADHSTRSYCRYPKGTCLLHVHTLSIMSEMVCIIVLSNGCYCSVCNDKEASAAKQDQDNLLLTVTGHRIQNYIG